MSFDIAQQVSPAIAHTVPLSGMTLLLPLVIQVLISCQMKSGLFVEKMFLTSYNLAGLDVCPLYSLSTQSSTVPRVNTLYCITYSHVCFSIRS